MATGSFGRVYTVILGGGRGQRLYPLTAHRAKPAVPLGGKYRLIDVPLSNAINSGFRNIGVLTQFNSASLNTHIAQTYRFDSFTQGNVEVFAAQQTESGGEWFEGTADAVRKNMRHIQRRPYDHLLILSGDHLYRMNYRELLARHCDAQADITVSVLPVPRAETAGFGVLGADPDGRIRAFFEKPRTDADLAGVAPSAELRAAWGLGEDEFVASMGVYVFRMQTVREVLANLGMLDFGHDILPAMIGRGRVVAHLFRGYWRDIGTIASFYEANLALTEENPGFRFFQSESPIFTRLRFLPASKITDARITRSIVSDGCLLYGAEIDHCVIGIRSRVQKGARVKDAILMGNDTYEEDELRAANAARGIDAMGIGPDCVVERAIVDKNARIGAGCVLKGAPGRPDASGDGWFVRDGIVIIPKDARIRAGTVV